MYSRPHLQRHAKEGLVASRVEVSVSRIYRSISRHTYLDIYLDRSISIYLYTYTAVRTSTETPRKDLWPAALRCLLLCYIDRI